MAQVHATIASGSGIEQLGERVRELERRVSALENQRGSPTAAELEPFCADQPQSQPHATLLSSPWLELATGAVPVLGRAILGIAGAYLLRAISESGTVPHLPVLAVAMLYAGTWLVWAVRAHATSRFASVTYAITMVLILSPLLWETTVRFQVLSPTLTAAALVSFVVLAMALAWRQKLQAIPCVAILALVATALALIIATRELVPFTAALLAIASATEVAVCLGHSLTLRAVPAIAADFAVWLVVEVTTSADGTPPAYHTISLTTVMVLCLALLAIYGGSIGTRSFAFHTRLTLFEVGQVVVAFVIGMMGLLRASHGSSARALGVLFLILAAVCYWGALSRFAADTFTRNRRVYATYAAAFLLAGSLLLFSADFEAWLLCLAAVAATLMYSRTRKLSLGMHATFYLAVAATISPLPSYAENALVGTVPVNPAWRVWVVAVSAALCYGIGSRVSEDHSKRRLLWVVPAVLFSFAAAALSVNVIAWMASGRVESNPSRLSVVRTLVICLLALVLSAFRSRSTRVELGWVAYATVAFGAVKLSYEDLRVGNAGSLVVSLLFYGLTLLLVPKLIRQAEGGS